MGIHHPPGRLPAYRLRAHHQLLTQKEGLVRRSQPSLLCHIFTIFGDDLKRIVSLMKTIWAKVCSPILMLVALVSLIGCGDSRLTEVEQLMETDVKAADSILSAMPMPTSRRDRAWYAVLKTQADYKQYKPITSDSLILTATDYYSAHRKSYRSAMAWYTQGCVYKEMKDNVAATESYLIAIDLFPDTLIRYYVLTEMSLAKCYLDKYMYDESLSLYNCCRNSAIRDADSTVLSYVDYQIALIKLYTQQFQGLDQAFLELNQDEKLSRFYREECLIQLAKYHICYTCELDSALFYLHSFMNGTKTPQGLAYRLKGDIYYQRGDVDSAYAYYLKSINEKCDIVTMCGSYKGLTEISLLSGNHTDAYTYGKLYTESLDSIRVLSNANEISSLIIDYNTKINSLKRRDFRTKTIIIFISSILLIILLSYGVSINHLNSINQSYISFCDNVWSTINSPLKENSTESDLLSYCKSRYMSSPSHYILFHDRETGICHLDKSAKSAILHDINIAFSDVIVDLINRDSSINNRDIQTCLLHYLGVDKRLLCEILNITDDNYRKIKSRMKYKLEDSYGLYFK